MWHWNQDNFEGLVAIAESIADEPLWQHFADYCRLREQGLRKPSLQSITRLIADAARWSTIDRRRFAEWIFETQCRHPKVHQLIVHPLNHQLLIPILQEWKDDEAVNDTPHRLLGIATGDHRHFADALALNPQNDFSRYRLVVRDLADIDFQCHHLPHYFIGEPGDAIQALNHAKELATGFVDLRIAASLQSEFDELRCKVEDWLVFQREGGDSFDVWCEKHKREYRWLKAYYYTR